MRGTLVALLLVAALAAPAVATPIQAAEAQPPASTQSHDDRSYALGGPVDAQVLYGDSELIVGSLTFDGLYDGDEEDDDRVEVTVSDDLNPRVHVLYSFHEDHDYEESAFFGPVEALEMGTFCTSDVLELPPKADVLELRLNSPEAPAPADCTPGKATTGTVDVRLLE